MKAHGDPNLICYMDGEYMRLGDANVGILTHALHYGTGVFEGIRAYWDAPAHELFLVRPFEHYARWKKNGGLLRINVPLEAGELCEITAELMRRNHFETNVYIRPIAFKSAERVGVSPDEVDAYAIVALPFGDYLNADNGVHAGVSSWRRIDDNMIPARGKICGAYVNSALASEEARRCGFDEAIFLNESGHVAEGATCNIFMVRNNKLITPPVTENILEGITRDSIVELAHAELSLSVIERPIDRSELYLCDELFFTGTAVGMAPIVRVDHHDVLNAKIGPITAELQRQYVDATRGHMHQYRHWVMPVYAPSPVGA